MNKVCKGCGIEKPISEYHKSRAFVDGINSKCKVCVNLYNSIRNKEKRLLERDSTPVFFRLSNTPKKDYCFMFEFMTAIGYNIYEDTHKQFCDKYNLPYKKRESKSKNLYTHCDCTKTDE